MEASSQHRQPVGTEGGVVVGGVLRGRRAWTVDVDGARIAEGAARAADFFGGWLRPDFMTRWADIREGLVESVAMTVVATAAGFLLSVPFGLGASKNLAPGPIYAACRGALAVFRAFHEILVAILFVAMFGFVGVGAEVALAGSLLMYAVQLSMGAIGGLVQMRRPEKLPGQP